MALQGRLRSPVFQLVDMEEPQSSLGSLPLSCLVTFRACDVESHELKAKS